MVGKVFTVVAVPSVSPASSVPKWLGPPNPRGEHGSNTTLFPELPVAAQRKENGEVSQLDLKGKTKVSKNPLHYIHINVNGNLMLM